MKRVCFVSPKYYVNTVGGAEIQLYSMAAGLAGTGSYEVFYVTPNIDETTTRGKLRIVKMPRTGSSTACEYEDFCRTLDALSPDLIFQVGRKQFTYHTARYCVSRRVPFMFRATSDIECRRMRQLPRFFSEYPLRRVVNPIRMGKELLMDYRTFWSMKQASAIVAQTSTQWTLLKKLFGDKDIVLVQNPHDVPPEEGLVKEEPPMVLWLASMKSVKRPRLFLEIVRALKDRNCRVVMAGRMNEERFRDDVERMQECGYMEYIENVTFEESNDLIGKARIFVLTSQREGLPNTLIQAWMRRTPTVSLGVDPDGMISRYGLGMYVNTVDTAVQAITRLLHDDGECDRIAGAAREFAQREFGLPAQIEKLREVVDRTFNAV